ncbi:hypothetical protein RFI_32635, partial [Reticulomyxa filosa]
MKILSLQMGLSKKKLSLAIYFANFLFDKFQFADYPNGNQINVANKKKKNKGKTKVKMRRIGRKRNLVGEKADERKVETTALEGDRSHSKRVHFSAELVEIIEPTKIEEKDEQSEGTVPVRRRSLRKLDDATAKRKQFLQMAKTNEVNDLSVFIAHQYYSYLEDGKSPLDALTLVAQKWEIKKDAVIEHLDACEFECMFHLYLPLFHF